MPYGLKYVTQFSSYSDGITGLPSQNYTLQFLFKDYLGAASSVVGGQTAVIQKCTLDDPLAPIKGQFLDIQLLNYGSLPIANFYSEDDNGIMVVLLNGAGNVLFKGFIVQDDLKEIIVDYVHGISLSASDSLGLLSGVIPVTNTVELSHGFSSAQVSSPTIHQIDLNLCYYLPIEYGRLVITGGTPLDGTYTPTKVERIGSNWYTVTVAETVGLFTITNGFAQSIANVDLGRNNSLLVLIGLCLHYTNIPLQLSVYNNTYETRQRSDRSTLEQTYIDTQSFVTGQDTFDNCGNILSKLLTTFNLQLFQANGQWVLVHWHEVRQYINNAIPAFLYDETLLPIGTSVLGNNFSIGKEPTPTRPLFSLQGGLLRPYKFVQKTFNYATPKYLLKNFDLLTLGALLRQYTSGTTTIYEYVATYWELNFGGAPVAERFIRVTKDTATDTELSRMLVIRGATFDSARSVQSYPIIANAGDKVKFSFSFRTNISQGGSINIVFALRLTDGTLNRYVDELPAGNGSWLSTIGFTYNIPSGDNSNQWHDVEIDSSQIPFAGVIICYLAEATANPQSSAKETQYQNIRFEYIPYINDSTKIIGQVHKQNRLQDVKQNLDEEIFVDDSPRNNITGSLYMNTLAGNYPVYIPNLTAFWRYATDATPLRLGQLTTQEIQTWRDVTRSTIEGGYVGLQQSNIISLLTVLQPIFYPTKNYIFGLLSIDYKRNKFNGTLWEIFDTGEAPLVADYTFKYLYSTI